MFPSVFSSRNLVLCVLSACFSLTVLPATAQIPDQESGQKQEPAAPRSFAAKPQVVASVDETQLTTLTGNTRPEARAKNDRGRVATDLPMGDLVLVLRRGPEQQAAFDAFVASLSEPSSPNYHRWLTPEEVGQNFGPAESDLDAATHWLQNHGFTIDDIAKNHMAIRFSGLASQVESAFHVEIHNLEITTKEGKVEKHIANMADPQIPSALVPVVVGVKALHNFFPHPMHTVGSMARRDSATSGWKRLPATTASASSPASSKLKAGSARPQFGINDPNNGYLVEDVTPYDFASIYNVLPLWNAKTPIDGTGELIAIAGTSNINPADIASFRSAFGLPAKAPTVIITNSDPGDCSDGDASCDGDLTENSLDVEWSGAIAKNASIILVTSSAPTTSTDPLYLSEDYIVQHKTAPVMNVSYGQCELFLGTSSNSEYNTLWQTAYAEGIAVFVSSGDSGSASCDDGGDADGTPYAAEWGLSVSGIASTPYNTAVGGTDLNWCPPSNSTCTAAPYWSTSNNSATKASAVGYIPEVPWNETCVSPGGIFESQYWAGQIGVSSPTDAESSCNFFVNYFQYIEELGGPDLSFFVDTVGGSGGKSSCTVNNTTSTTADPTSCTGGYAKPSWQTGVTGIPNDGKRDIPDVSFFASDGFLGSAYLICVSANGACTYSDTSEPIYQEVGGTSVGSPIMAAVMALINQKAGSPQGSPNTELYKLAAKQTYSSCSAESVTNSSSCVFHDINTATIAQPCDYTSSSPNCTIKYTGDEVGILPGYSATTGFDLASGLGSANVANLVNSFSSTVIPAPAVTFTPTSVAFPSTAVGGTTAPTSTVVLKNTGNATLTISKVSITGTDASSFTETNTCGTSVAAGASCSISLGFKPAVTGALTASVSVTDNASGSPQTVALTGTGTVLTAPAVTFTPASIAFSSTLVGVAATAKAVTVKNTGNAVLDINSINLVGSTAFSLAAKTCGSTLAAGASCTVTVGFKPASSGALAVTLDLNDNIAGSPQTVAITGTGIAPAVTLSATKLTFAATLKGASATTQAITVKNSGTASLTVSSIALGGTDASSFLIAGKTCATTLATGSSCTVTVGFKPTATGALTASLVFTDSASPTTQTVALSGTGTLPATTLSATSLTFPSTLEGVSATVLTITLKNSGTAALAISKIAVAGSSSFSIPSKTCGTSLVVGASCTVSVGFKPTATGAITGTLTFTDDAATATQVVALKGTGVAPIATFTPTSLTFASTIEGESATSQKVTLKNTGTATLTLSTITIGGTYHSSFSIASKTCTTTLAAGASCVITVGFKPAAIGKLTAGLSFTDSAAGSPQSVGLSGTGAAAPTLSVIPASLTFPPTTTGDDTPSQVVTVKNTGKTAATFTSFAISGTNASAFIQSRTCTTSLAAGASCTISVHAKPTAAGSLTASLLVSDDASSSPQKVALTATGGTPPEITIAPGSLAFPSVTSAEVSGYSTVNIKNTGETTFYISSVALAGASPESFKIVNGCVSTLAPGAACDLHIAFAPQAAGAVTANVTVTANNPTVTKVVNLSGTGK